MILLRRRDQASCAALQPADVFSLQIVNSSTEGKDASCGQEKAMVI